MNEQNLMFSSFVPKQDRDILDPFPLPLVILGMKYDLFQVKVSPTYFFLYSDRVFI